MRANQRLKRETHYHFVTVNSCQCFTNLRTDFKKGTNSRQIPPEMEICSKPLSVHFTDGKRFDIGPLRELNPGPPAPETRIIPLDQVDVY